MFEIKIYTDGACSGNPGPGGWGAILTAFKQDKLISEKELCGGSIKTTNNQMELTAAIESLKELKRPTKVTVVTDSKYLMDGITKWLPNWQSNDWKNSKNKKVKNIELWRKIQELSRIHDISWEWVKGHSLHKENERADYLARMGMRKYKE